MRYYKRVKCKHEGCATVVKCRRSSCDAMNYFVSKRNTSANNNLLLKIKVINRTKVLKKTKYYT